MKVDLSNGSSLSCQFYYTYQICEYFLLLRRKKLLCSDIVNFWGVEIPKLNIVFKGVSEGGRRWGVEVFLRRPIIGTYCNYNSLVQKAFQGL